MQELDVIQKIAICFIPVLFAITVHEVAHGWVASKFGDQTAKLSGRLTLNPVKHIDLVGTLLIPALLLLVGNFIFGWAKPVPVDARNMRNPRLDMIFVAAAGPVSNLLMAIIWAGVAKIGYMLLPDENIASIPLIYMGQAGIKINVVLAVLNCLPIPPLDGSRILFNILPPRFSYFAYRVESYGFIILLILMATGVLSMIMSPIIILVIRGITLLFGLT